MLERLVHAILGFFLGALVTASALWWLDEINWAVVAAGGGICAVLAFIWGLQFLEWLKDLFWDI